MKAKYDRIGKEYNRTRKADLYLVERLIKHLCTQENQKYLDIGCGTGNYTIALSKKGFDFVGVEPSEKMLNVAKSKNDKIEWKSGTAENLPLEDESVSGGIATLTTHHWENLGKAFLEINRVLKPNGRFVIFTSNSKLMSGYWLNHYFPIMLDVSMNQMPSFERTVESLGKAKFDLVETEKYFVREDLEDLFLYSGKHRPNMYLVENFRQGISSFSNLANKIEIERGLKELEKDIESGKIKEIIAEYENHEGDYLYMISEKRQ